MIRVDDCLDRIIWRNIKVFNENSVFFLNSDYYQENFVVRAIDKKCPKAAWLVISYILENFEASFTSSFYQMEIMKSLDSILA